MEKTRRKNAAGAWIRERFLVRILTANGLFMAVVGCGLGLMIGALPVFDGLAGSPALWLVVPVALILAFGIYYAYCERVGASWLPGLKSEQQIGDLIGHAVTQRGCAFAHDVKEALGGPGNVDHVVMTPAGIWVVETKAHRVPKSRFPAALRQVALNVGRVRSHLETSLPVRGALVIADRSEDELEKQFGRKGKVVHAFGAKKFWLVLKAECEQTDTDARSPELLRVERAVWDLGSTRHLGS